LLTFLGNVANVPSYNNLSKIADPTLTFAACYSSDFESTSAFSKSAGYDFSANNFELFAHREFQYTSSDDTYTFDLHPLMATQTPANIKKVAV